MKNCLYIELNADKIKLMYKGKRTHEFILKMSEGAIVDGEILDVESIANTIKNTKKKMKIQAKKCSFCINSSQTIVKQFSIPLLENKEEERRAVETSIAESIPEILESHSMSYKTYEEANGMSLGIAVLFPKALISAYLSLAKELAMEIDVMDVSQNCAIKYYQKIEQNKNAILIDFSYNYINAILINNHRFLLGKYLMNGFNFVEYNMLKQIELAEKEVAATGNFHEDGEYAVKACIRESITELEGVITQFVDYMRYNKSGEEIQEVFLYGDYADVELLGDVMKNITTIPIGICNEKNIFHVNLLGCSVRE